MKTMIEVSARVYVEENEDLIRTDLEEVLRDRMHALSLGDRSRVERVHEWGPEITDLIGHAERDAEIEAEHLHEAETA